MAAGAASWTLMGALDDFLPQEGALIAPPSATALVLAPCWKLDIGKSGHGKNEKTINNVNRAIVNLVH